MTVHEARSHLVQLEHERTLARDIGLAGCSAYMADLETEIATWRNAFVAAAVMEIASFRAELSGPQQG